MAPRQSKLNLSQSFYFLIENIGIRFSSLISFRSNFQNVAKLLSIQYGNNLREIILLNLKGN